MFRGFVESMLATAVALLLQTATSASDVALTTGKLVLFSVLIGF